MRGLGRGRAMRKKTSVSPRLGQKTLNDQPLDLSTVAPYRGDGGGESGSAAVPYVTFPAEYPAFARHIGNAMRQYLKRGRGKQKCAGSRRRAQASTSRATVCWKLFSFVCVPSMLLG